MYSNYGTREVPTIELQETLQHGLSHPTTSTTLIQIQGSQVQIY